MGFFEKPERINKFKKDEKIDEHVDFSLTEKELSLEDYTDQLNFNASVENNSKDKILSSNEKDGSETIAQRIQDIQEALEYYESLPQDEKIEARVKELRDMLKMIHPDSVLIDPNLN